MNFWFSCQRMTANKPFHLCSPDNQDHPQKQALRASKTKHPWHAGLLSTLAQGRKDLQSNVYSQRDELNSSVLAWIIPWTGELGGLQSMGLQRVGRDCERMHALNLAGYTSWKSNESCAQVWFFSVDYFFSNKSLLFCVKQKLQTIYKVDQALRCILFYF